MSDIHSAFVKEEQPVNYQNMLFWQKLYAIHLLQAADLFLRLCSATSSSKSEQFSE